jgi:hypothetical protein
MKSAILDSSRIVKPQQSRQPSASMVEHPLTVDQLARAVGEHALRQAEIDKKMATRIVELRDELNSAKSEIRSLRAEIDRLMQGLSAGLALAREQSANANESAWQTSLASLRSR